ncbi:beta-lactamase class penicillin binding protein [Moniliophthora roreri MCA 2997]|uniref:Beta-lactamase class penicillin binding protein n=1 Tax=Moniliophthora roreri (strain MCA 2997) TaxID=1381753 RepID=V2WY70_MONRO|nr:beta-lactamase class penicillin binding protein [Moniliophthora roreri MCA 2997]
MRTLLSLAGGLFLLPSVLAQNSTSTSPILSPKIDIFIQDLMKEWGTPGGVSVAVVRLGSSEEWQVETKGYGVAKLQDGTNFTADTLLSMCSNSKLFDVVATGLLMSNESVTPKINWATKIASVIPEWKIMDSYASEKASIIDLMSHRTGLPRHEFMFRRGDTIPSMTWQYTNHMYNVLAYLPEVLSTKTTLARYVKQHVFDALGMNASTYSFDVANASGNLADGIARENFDATAGLPGTGTPRFMPHRLKVGGEDVMSGSCGVISSANDMAIWLQTLLLRGKHPQTGEQVIPAEVLGILASGVTVEIPSPQQSVLSPTVYGGAQTANSYQGHYVVEHDGDLWGAHTTVSRLPFDNLGVAVLTNDEDVGPSIRAIIKYRIIDEALGLEPYDWNSFYKNQLPGGVAPADNSSLPQNTSDPSIEVTRLAGTYNNPGYGNWTFCLISEETTGSCRESVANASTHLPGFIDPTVPILVAKLDAVLTDYVLLMHSDGNEFDGFLLISNPTNDSEQPFWAKSLGSFKAEFASTDDGIGMAISGNFWGATPGLPEPTGDSVRERAEVWFSQVAPSA